MMKNITDKALIAISSNEIIKNKSNMIPITKNNIPNHNLIISKWLGLSFLSNSFNHYPATSSEWISICYSYLNDKVRLMIHLHKVIYNFIILYFNSLPKLKDITKLFRRIYLKAYVSICRLLININKGAIIIFKFDRIIKYYCNKMYTEQILWFNRSFLKVISHEIKSSTLNFMNTLVKKNTILYLINKNVFFVFDHFKNIYFRLENYLYFFIYEGAINNIGKFTIKELFNSLLSLKNITSILGILTIKSSYYYITKLAYSIGKVLLNKINLKIIELKNLFLDYSILASAITNKLKDRNKRILKIINKIFSLSKNPIFKIHLFKEHITGTFAFNKILNNYMTSLGTSVTNNFFSIFNFNMIPFKYLPYLYKIRILLFNLKNKIVSGISLIGSGRLTRRLTASRSISKQKKLGSLLNIYSSSQGLSTVMTRGFLKSNMQNINLNSYNRNGTFGVKVSVSSFFHSFPAAGGVRLS